MGLRDEVNARAKGIEDQAAARKRYEDAKPARSQAMAQFIQEFVDLADERDLPAERIPAYGPEGPDGRKRYLFRQRG